MGTWPFDPAGFDYWSPELFRMYGLDPACKPPTIQEYLDCVHPQDRGEPRMPDTVPAVVQSFPPLGGSDEALEEGFVIRLPLGSYPERGIAFSYAAVNGERLDVVMTFAAKNGIFDVWVREPKLRLF